MPMGLLMEIYAFAGTAPAHDQVYQTICAVLGRQLPKEEYGPTPGDKPRADWREAEERGNLLVGDLCTTVFENDRPRSRYLEIQTLLRGDKIVVGGNSKTLFDAAKESLSKLGGKLDPDPFHRQARRKMPDFHR